MDEVRRSLEKYQRAFADLVSKHEEYTLLIEDDSVFDSEEAWLEQCQEAFMKLKLDTEVYIKERMISQKRFIGQEPTRKLNKKRCPDSIFSFPKIPLKRQFLQKLIKRNLYIDPFH